MRAIRPCSDKCFDTHLMVAPVDLWVEPFARAGADRIVVHAEATPHLDRTLQAIERLGKLAGVSLNPATPETAVEYVLDRIDLILVMTVNPGFGGQRFIPAVVEKIRRLRAMTAGRGIRIQVDGGITPETAHCRRGRRIGSGRRVRGCSASETTPPPFAPCAHRSRFDAMRLLLLAAALLAGGTPPASAAMSGREVRCLALVAYTEAAVDGPSGMAAVIRVVRNRMADPRFPSDACAVILQVAQFQPIAQSQLLQKVARDPEGYSIPQMLRLTGPSSRRSCPGTRLARLQPAQPGPTGGALYFVNPD